MNLDVHPHLSLFDLPDEDLSAFFDAIPSGLGVRGAFVKTVEPTLTEHAPEHLGRLQALADALPPVPLFGFIPVQHMLLFAGYAAHLTFPGQGFVEATNSFVEAGMRNVFKVPIMNPLFAACDNDLTTFMEVLAASQGLFYDHGEMDFQRLEARQVQMRYDGFSANVMACVTTGYWRGVMKRFGAPQGTVTFEREDDMHSTSTLRW